LIRDFKGFTSKKILNAIEENLPNKVEKNGCFGCLKEPERKTVTLLTDNFGNKIIILLKFDP